MLLRERAEIVVAAMDWLDVITSVLTSAVLVALARVAMRSRPAGPSGDTVVLRFPKAMRWFLFGCAMFLAVVVGSALWLLLPGNPTHEEVLMVWIGVPIVLLAFAAAMGAQREELVVDRDGIGGRTAFRGTHRIVWRDVVEVSWSSVNQWSVLVDRYGTKLRVHQFLQGHHVVPAMLREHVPEPVWREAVAAWERAASDAPRSGWDRAAMDNPFLELTSEFLLHPIAQR